jgi:hypothetical protein
MSYSRDHPSAKYQSMIALYRELHAKGERRLGLPPEATYPGVSLLPHIGHIKDLIVRTGARTILDYGCGKGLQYEPQKIAVPGEGEWDGVIEYWDVDEVRCYDPCYEPYSKLPEGKFDGVVSTDVLEHCIEDDIPWIIAEMFSYADRFVFANVACYPALTTLPNGENAHCTVRPIGWWQEIFAAASRIHPQVLWKLYVEEHAHSGHGDSETGRIAES